MHRAASNWGDTTHVANGTHSMEHHCCSTDTDAFTQLKEMSSAARDGEEAATDVRRVCGRSEQSTCDRGVCGGGGGRGMH